MNLYYQSIGSGQPLIIIHGLFGSSDNWRSIAKFFSKYYQVVCVDLRNHGRSPHDDTMDFVSMAADIEQLCQTLNFKKIHLLGHSLGGKVAMKFAECYPDYLDKLIVVDISTRQYQGQHTPLMDAMMALDLNAYTSRTEVDKALTEAVPDKAVRGFLLMNLIIENQQLSWRINLPVLKANYREYMKAVFEDKQQFDKPSLFIYGENSDYVLSEDRDDISAVFSQVQFLAMPTGHWVHAERPQQFMKSVESFLI